MPVADLDVARMWCAGSGLDKLLEAHQERGPLGAAVVHELARLAPTLVREQDDRVVVLPLQAEADVGADPLRRAVGHLPFDELVRALGEHLHVEPARVAEPEPDRAADGALARGVGGPPSGEAVPRRECVVHRLRSGGRPDAMQDVNHDHSSPSCRTVATIWLLNPTYRNRMVASTSEVDRRSRAVAHGWRVVAVQSATRQR